MATVSGASVRIGGCGWFWFCGICWVRSGPSPTPVGCTVIALGLIVTLTRAATCGLGSVGWLCAPQPAATSASAPIAPTTAALGAWAQCPALLDDAVARGIELKPLALPRPTPAECNRRAGRPREP